MIVKDEDVKSLAKQIDTEDTESLAELFMQLLELEHAARHQSRPRLVKNFTEKIDDKRSDL